MMASGIQLGSYYAQTAVQAAQGASPATQPALNIMRDALHEMHKVVSDLHGVADRACGISGEEGAVPQAPIPVGMIGEIASLMDALRSRLHGLHSRLSSIA